jgi:hypothetical protein
MEKALNYLVGHPVLLVLSVIVAIIILLPFVRKIVQLLLPLAALMLLYAIYIHFTGGKMPEFFQYMERAFSAILGFIVDAFKHLFDIVKSPKKEFF